MKSCLLFVFMFGLVASIRLSIHEHRSSLDYLPDEPESPQSSHDFLDEQESETQHEVPTDSTDMLEKKVSPAAVKPSKDTTAVLPNGKKFVREEMVIVHPNAMKKEEEIVEKKLAGKQEFIPSTEINEEIAGYTSGDIAAKGADGKTHLIVVVDGDELYSSHQVHEKKTATKTLVQEYNGEDEEKVVQHSIRVDIKLWPQGEIPYSLGEFLPVVKADLLNAIDYLNYHLKGCVSFKEKPADYVGPYLMMTESLNGCAANVGYRESSTTFLNLSPGCKFGNIIHELMHSLGDVHEQEREYRDGHIEVNYDNIQPSETDNFDIISNKENPIEGLGKFDFHSVMMYPKDAFGKRPDLQTIATLPATYEDKIGQRVAPSAQDMEKIRGAYQCKEGTLPKGWTPPYKANAGFTSYSRPPYVTLRADGLSEPEDSKNETSPTGINQKKKKYIIGIDMCKPTTNETGGYVFISTAEPNFSITAGTMNVHCMDGLPADMYMRCFDEKDCPTTTCIKGRCNIDYLNLVNMCEKYQPCIKGTCANVVGSFKCTCEKGFLGEKCDTDQSTGQKYAPPTPAKPKEYELCSPANSDCSVCTDIKKDNKYSPVSGQCSWDFFGALCSSDEGEQCYSEKK